MDLLDRLLGHDAWTTQQTGSGQSARGRRSELGSPRSETQLGRRSLARKRKLSAKGVLSPRVQNQS
jgi:hypothetical protein